MNNKLEHDQIIINNVNDNNCSIEFENGALNKVNIEFIMDNMISLKIGVPDKKSRIIARQVENNLYTIISGISFLEPYRIKDQK